MRVQRSGEPLSKSQCAFRFIRTQRGNGCTSISAIDIGMEPDRTRFIQINRVIDDIDGHWLTEIYGLGAAGGEHLIDPGAIPTGIAIEDDRCEIQGVADPDTAMAEGANGAGE